MHTVRLRWVRPQKALALTGLVLSGCDAAEHSNPASSAQLSVPPQMQMPEVASPPMSDDATAEPAAPAELPVDNEAFPFDVCERAGEPPFTQIRVMYGIASDYEAKRWADCRTQGLTPLLDERKTERWLGYLINYSMAMSGCPLTLGPAEGGILTFGPANTQAIDMTRPRLGRDDAGLLLDQYLGSFAEALQLSDEERSSMQTYLWSTAEHEIDSQASAVLSRCEPGSER
jgi:hypothetical protein